MASIKENIIDVPLDALKISIPSLLYLLQNSLLYVALSNLSAPLFQVTYQSKLLTTAVVSVIMLKRVYNVRQWFCLTMLGIGVAIVVMAESGSDKKKEGDSSSQSLFVGLVAVTISCFSSALAGVYFEMVLKKSTTTVDGVEKKPVSLWMRNIQLAFFSVIIAVVNQWRLTGDDAEKPFLHGFTFWVWIVVLLQAGGGLLVAAIIKYADNVLKGLATGVSVVVSTIGSMLLFGTPLTLQFVVGAVVILTSVYFFTNDIPSCMREKCKEKVNEDIELGPSGQNDDEKRSLTANAEHK
jgi:UDP-sugar transporter A1/2/3